MIITVAAVLVLNLYADHPAAAVGLPLGDDRDQCVEPGVDVGEVGRVVGPQGRPGPVVVE